MLHDQVLVQFHKLRSKAAVMTLPFMTLHWGCRFNIYVCVCVNINKMMMLMVMLLQKYVSDYLMLPGWKALLYSTAGNETWFYANFSCAYIKACILKHVHLPWLNGKTSQPTIVWQILYFDFCKTFYRNWRDFKKSQMTQLCIIKGRIHTK